MNTKYKYALAMGVGSLLVRRRSKACTPRQSLPLTWSLRSQ
jgi:hypothetical protein